jgi:GntR family transcriptional regulator / MocR family aminotransferase
MRPDARPRRGTRCPPTPPSAAERRPGQVRRRRRTADRGSPAIDQRAFADFVEHGEFDRHLRRTRPVYRRRRDAPVDALRAHLADVDIAGVEAGQQVGCPMASTRRRSSRPPPRRACSSTVARSTASPGPGSGRPGPIFGYSALTEREIAEGVCLLAHAIQPS